MTKMADSRGAAAGYSGSLEHILSELARIDLMVKREVERARAAGRGNDEFRGLYISEEEVDNLLETGPVGETVTPERDETLRRYDRALDALAADSAARLAATEDSGRLRLAHLTRSLDLTPFDRDVLLIALAGETDLRYERLYAYLQDDVTKRRPGVDLIMRLLCRNTADRLAARQRFAPQAPLLRHELILLHGEAATRQVPLLAKFVKLDERIVAYLLDSDDPDDRLRVFAKVVRPRALPADLQLPAETKARLARLAASQDPRQLAFQFLGPPGTGKVTAAEAVCQQLGVSLLVVNVDAMLAADQPLEASCRAICREAVLQRAALYLDRFELLLADDPKLLLARAALAEGLAAFQSAVFVGGEGEWSPVSVLPSRVFVRVPFSVPDYAARLALWRTRLNGGRSHELDGALPGVASKFRLTGEQIRDATILAGGLARWRAPADGGITPEDLQAACRAISDQRLASLSQKIVPRYTWTDIVLPEDQLAQLREIASYVKHRHVVYEAWGFERRLALGKGLNALFAGPSGTGKTMAAEIIAGVLGLDLYKVDLSQTVSKYIGETEKNLDRIFAAGQGSNAVLFFDEADALFGKRSEVRDAHDRYANIEIAYLLQRMEEYEGIVVLATNLRKNLDEAFVRRLHFAVEFPFPEEEDRLRIWRLVFPAAVPLAADVDLPFLARQFKIPGGNIKNIAVAAAFLAAEEESAVTMTHLVRATRREFQKMGKLCDKADFGPYFALVANR